MHELSIAQSIIEICDSNIPDKTVNVKIIELEIGQLSGVVIDALDTAMNQIKKGTIYENAVVKIIEIKAEAKCLNCGNIFKPEDYFSPCPECSEFGVDIIKGEEMSIKAIELE